MRLTRYDTFAMRERRALAIAEDVLTSRMARTVPIRSLYVAPAASETGSTSWSCSKKGVKRTDTSNATQALKRQLLNEYVAGEGNP
jgi:hypothetical protein